jgi:hypothetical protein
MPTKLAAGFYGYDRFNVERVQAYGKSALRELVKLTSRSIDETGV